MILPILGLCIVAAIVLGIIALDEFAKWRKGGQRPALWQWIAMAVWILVAISYLVLAVGEYRIEGR